jgi:hypothetical protein
MRTINNFICGMRGTAAANGGEIAGFSKISPMKHLVSIDDK